MNFVRPRIRFLVLAAACIAVVLFCGCVKGPDFPYMLSPRAIVQTPTNPASANIAVTFQLIDREKENGNVILEYSTDSGVSFKSATLVDTSEAQNLQSDWFPGIIHTVRWNSVTTNMVGISGDASVIVKVTPWDATNPSGGTAGSSGTFTVNNIAYNKAPTVTLSALSGVKVGNVQLDYTLTDVESDACSIAVEYSVDGGTSWHIATKGPIGEGVSGISSSPSGTAHIFFWDSRADSVGLLAQEDNVKIRITPSDFHAGTADQTGGPFSVNNTASNSPPTVTITDGPADGSTVGTSQVTFTWTGSDTDGTVTGYYYCFDRNVPDIWTTDTSITSGTLPDGSHVFRVVAIDDLNAFSVIVVRTFTVLFILPPAKVTNPTPADGAAGVAVTQALSWNRASRAGSYDVYLGTDQNMVASADRSSNEFKRNQTALSYGPPGDLDYSITYYWRIDSVNIGGTTKGDVWSFTTRASLSTIYVDGTNGSNTNTGLTWAQAVKTIQKGLDLAGNAGWMVLAANGRYTGTGNKNLDFKGKAIHLKSVGGAGNCTIDCENSGRGFYFHTSETANSIVDGFTIRNGSVWNGGGICCENSSPTIANCLIVNNYGDDYGGGVYCYSSSPTITNCTILNNRTPGDEGGGIYCSSTSNPAITNCVIAGNSAYNGGGIYCTGTSNPAIANSLIANNTASYGGGIYCYQSNPTITDCTIANNTASSNGGGIYCSSTAKPTLSNSVLWGNSASSNGNQIYLYDLASVATLRYCDYANGTNDVVGSGTVTPSNCINSDPQFVDASSSNFHLAGSSPCIDVGSNSLIPAGITTDLDGRPRISNSVVDIGAYEGKWLLVPSAYATIQAAIDAASGGDTVLVANGTYTGTGNKDLDFKGKAICMRSAGGAANCIIDCENSGRGFYFHTGEGADSTLDGFTIRNGSSDGGGGIYCYNSSFPTIRNCCITNNSATGSASGGGVYCQSYASPTIINCVIADNSAQNGGGISCDTSSNFTTINCTIASNTARVYGGGIYCEGNSSPVLDNTVMWGNSATSDGNQIYTYDAASAVRLSYCDYADGTNDVGGSGTVTPSNCTTSDPVFVDAANKNYRLQGTSPCIDRGSNTYVPADLTADLDGNPRIAYGVVDIGAYEYVPSICVDGTSGNDTNNGLSWAQAVKTIQKGLDLANIVGQTVLVADGTYTGTGNKILDFKGKAIHLKSVGGTANCIIDCQNSNYGFNFHTGETTNSIVDGFTIRGGYAGYGGGIYCSSSSPTIADCVIVNNLGTDNGGGIYCYSSSPRIINCTIANNGSYSRGGGIYCYSNSNPAIINCVIAGNSADYGGSIYCTDSSSPTITSCAITNNNAPQGGGIYCRSSSKPTLNNSVLWWNSAISLGNQIYTYDSGSGVILNYSDYANGANDVAGSGTVTPSNCINSDPQFVDPWNRNYRLQSTSPCIDAGDNSLVPAGVTTDLDGNPRITNGVVDMGAYEYQP